MSAVPLLRRGEENVGGQAERRGLSRLMLRWPAARKKLQAGVQSDPDFKSLCAAYEEAHEALETRRRRAKDVAAEMSDYERLIGELETDIQARIDWHRGESNEKPGRWQAIWHTLRTAFSS